jgi:hypothetical protein
MSDYPPSSIALVLATPVEDVVGLVAAARAAGDIDRSSPTVGTDGSACDVHWGGRMQRAVVRAVEDPDDGASLLRTEAVIGPDGFEAGLARQATLLRALVRQIPGGIRSVRDLASGLEHEPGWVPRVALGAVELEDGIRMVTESDGPDDSARWWLHTHGAARFGVPDLELYGLTRTAVASAEAIVATVMRRLLAGGMGALLMLPDGTRVRLIPVLEAWPRLPLDWPGIGRAGRDRGPGLDGPRATLSIHHQPRLGRFRLDLEGVIDRVTPSR